MATTQDYKQVRDTARSHLNSCNGLVWNDYLNCDSPAAEEAFEAERSEMAYLDHQLAELASTEHSELRDLRPEVVEGTPNLDELEAESEHCVCEQNAQFHLIPLWDITTDSTLRRQLLSQRPASSEGQPANDQQPSNEYKQGLPSPLAKDYTRSSWLQENMPASATPPNAIMMCKTCDKPHPETAPQAKRVLAETKGLSQDVSTESCSTCGQAHHQCHCRRHEIMREKAGEESHLNLHPRRHSSGRLWAEQ